MEKIFDFISRPLRRILTSSPIKMDNICYLEEIRQASSNSGPLRLLATSSEFIPRYTHPPPIKEEETTLESHPVELESLNIDQLTELIQSNDQKIKALTQKLRKSRILCGKTIGHIWDSKGLSTCEICGFTRTVGGSSVFPR